LDKLFNDDGIGQSSEDTELLVPIEMDRVLRLFHPVSHPCPPVLVVDMHELHADRTAVGSPQMLEDFAQGKNAYPGNLVSGESPVQVGLRKAVKRWIQLGLDRPRSL